MLTLFTIPKAFQGHNGIIQRNAIRSWTLLRPECEIILLADDEGTAEVAEELGVRHIPAVARNEFGTPLLDSAFQLAEHYAKYPLLCYVNADIILMGDLLEAVKIANEHTGWFLMTAQRWNLDVEEPLNFGPGWEDKLRVAVSNHGRLHHHTGIDFWVYPKGLLNDMPPFAIGRVAYECWCLYKARIREAQLIDATSVVKSVHQNHDYSHHPDGERGVGTGLEAQRNREMVGGKPYFFTIRDRTHILTHDKMKRARDGWRLWRGIRTAQVLPLSAPLPVKLMVKALNNIINGIRDALVLAARVRAR